MLPRWHILLGGIFSLVFYLFFPKTNPFFIGLIFLASFLIDFDHYLASALKTGKWSLKKSFEYHRLNGIIQNKEKSRGVRRRGDFHPFHTIEFHIIVFLLAFIWSGFYYIFIGMLFHSILDIIYLIKLDFMYRREFLLINWVRKRLNKAN